MTLSFSVMTGLVPVISIHLAKPCHGYRDRRVKPGDDAFHRSRGAVRTRVVVQELISPLSAPIFVRECRRWMPVVSRSLLRATFSRKKARKRNAERRVANLRTQRGAARAERCALASRRPTTALAAASERHSSTQATRFLGRDYLGAGVTRSRPSCSAAVYRPQTGHRAGRAYPPGPPGSDGDEPLPAGTDSRSALRSDRMTSLYVSEIGIQFSEPDRDVKAFLFVVVSQFEI